MLGELHLLDLQMHLHKGTKKVQKWNCYLSTYTQKSVWKQHQKTDKQNFKATGNMYQKQVFLKESAPKTTIFRKLSLSHSQRETTWTRFWYRKHTDFNKSDSAHHKISRCKIHSKIHVKEKIWPMDIWIFQKSNKQTDRGLHKKQRVWEKTYHYLN